MADMSDPMTGMVIKGMLFSQLSQVGDEQLIILQGFTASLIQDLDEGGSGRRLHARDLIVALDAKLESDLPTRVWDECIYPQLENRPFEEVAQYGTLLFSTVTEVLKQRANHQAMIQGNLDELRELDGG